MKTVRQIILLFIFICIPVAAFCACVEIGGDFVDIDVAKTKPELQPNAFADYSHGYDVLNVQWGDSENQFKYYISDEATHSCGAPTSYAVTKSGEIYVYDALNTSIKIFKDNKLKKVLDMTEEHRRLGGFSFISMTVTDDGTIYAADVIGARLLKVVGNTVSAADEFGEIGYPDTISLLPDGQLMIRDNYYQDGSIRIRRFDQKRGMEFENKMGFFLSESNYEYTDGNGNLIRIAENGFKGYQISLIDKSGKILGMVNFSDNIAEDYLGGFPTSMRLIGSDAEGNLYAEVKEDPNDKIADKTDYEVHDLLVKIDIINNTIDTLRIKPYFLFNPSKITMSNSNILYSRVNVQVDREGNVYKAYMTEEDGFTIVKYSFPN